MNNFLKSQELAGGIRCYLTLSYLTFKRPMFPSYRNQTVGLLSKSTDCFLYDGNIGC